jgi:hypothetical protein
LPTAPRKKNPKVKRLAARKQLDFTARMKNKSHKNQLLMQYTEDNMKKAMAHFNDQNNKLSYRKVAELYQVPFSTFYHKMKGRGDSYKHCVGGKHRPRIIPLRDEVELVRIIVKFAKHGFSFIEEEVRDIAYQFAEEHNLPGFSKDTEIAGRSWFQHFLDRHKSIEVKKSSELSVFRATCANPTTMDNWFNLYKGILETNKITDPRRIWNLDESGLQDVPTSQKVVGPVGAKCISLVPAEKGETTTILTCVNAVGECTKNMIIFRGVRTQATWREGMPEALCFVKASKKGYINKDLFFEFGCAFIKHLADSKLLGDPIILLMDGHYSHVFNINFMELMVEHQVFVLALPPHTTHHLQPLDRGVFRSFKYWWNKFLHKNLKLVGGRKLVKSEWWSVLTKTIQKGLTVSNIQGGFRVTGIYPVSREAITEDQLLPSALPNPLDIENSDDEDCKLAFFGVGSMYLIACSM